MAAGKAILVEIGTKIVGGNIVHDYPDWTQLPLEKTGGVDHRTHQLVKWRYDREYGHDDDGAAESPASPAGTWLGMMVVTAQFASEAVTLFPTLVTVLTETEAQAFWENRHGFGRPDEETDAVALSDLDARLALLTKLGKDNNDLEVIKAKQKSTKALDPLDSEPGVKKSKDKKWTDAKKALGFTITP